MGMSICTARAVLKAVSLYPGAVLRITINRPERRNAMNEEVCAGIADMGVGGNLARLRDRGDDHRAALTAATAAAKAWDVQPARPTAEVGEAASCAAQPARNSSSSRLIAAAGFKGPAALVPASAAAGSRRSCRR